MKLQIEGAVVTHVGRVRTKNEDNYSLFGKYRKNMKKKTRKDEKTIISRRAAAAVFDGMGGEEAGEIASLIATCMFSACALEKLKEEVSQQVQTVNDAICSESKRRGNIRMGTTMTALYLDQNTAVCCNVGDSRCYFLRGGVLHQLSVDHSEAMHMIEMGIMSEEEARKSNGWHILTQCLGIFREEFLIEPHFSQPIVLQPDDMFLLCSDGLTDMVMDKEIGSILQISENAKKRAEALVEAALENGGKDNVTALVIHVKKPYAPWRKLLGRRGE